MIGAFFPDADLESLPRPHTKSLSAEVLLQAKHLATTPVSEHDGRPLFRPRQGPGSVLEVLQQAGVVCTAAQLRYAEQQGWELPGQSGVPTKFLVQHVAIIMELALNNPLCTKQQLRHMFTERTGLSISDTYCWQIARKALQYRPALKSPILTLSHRALRQEYHRLQDLQLGLYPNIVWSDESYFNYTHTMRKGQKVFCLSAEDPRRNVPGLKHERAIMVHGAVSLAFGPLPLTIFEQHHG